MSFSTSKTEIERGGIVPDAVVLELYQKMLTVFYVEERLKVFDRLGKVSFHASTRGHEKLQIGMTLLLKPRRDWFFTYSVPDHASSRKRQLSAFGKESGKMQSSPH